MRVAGHLLNLTQAANAATCQPSRLGVDVASHMAQISIRRITREEGQVFRKLRLAALGDAPDAFGSRYSDEATRDDDHWDKAAQRFSAGSAETALFGELDGEVVGLAICRFGDVVLPDNFNAGVPRAELMSMWVEPAARAAGIGRLLVNDAVDWAVSEGAAAVVLDVNEARPTAIALYERCGFSPTGHRAPLESDPTHSTIQMALRIG